MADTTVPVEERRAPVAETRDAWALVVVSSAEQPSSVGDVALLPLSDRALTLGRGESEDDDRVRLVRQRPGRNEPASPIADKGISRRQLVLRAQADGIRLTGGAGQVRVNGALVDEATLGAGDVIDARGRLAFVCTKRPPVLPALVAFDEAMAARFGEADAFGRVGESAVMWRLRERVAVVEVGAPTLVHGPLGSGKRNAFRGAFVSSGPAWVVAEASTPATGAQVRAWLEAARGGTLVLHHVEEWRPADVDRVFAAVDDAFDGLPPSVRIVGTTRLAPAVLEGGIDAHFFAHVAVPPLSERREDIPLLARHFVQKLANQSPERAGRFVGSGGEVRFDAGFVERLVRREYRANVRELASVVSRAIAASEGDVLTWKDEGDPPATASRVTSRSVSAPDALRSPSAPPAKPAGLPAIRAWSELRVHLLDGHVASFRVGAQRARRSYIDLGMASEKNRNPVIAWTTLVRFCEGGGAYKWKPALGTFPLVTKQVSELRARLKELFAMEEDPFDFKHGKGWVAKFVVKGGSAEEDEDE